jgi:PAS domain S-box-containing protein
MNSVRLFYFLKEHVMRKDKKGRTGPEGSSQVKILIVEDEAIVAKDMELCLSSFGYSICGIVASGEDALAAAGEIQPNLIILDMMLKGKLDGIETAHRIRTQFGIPVIFVTAYSDENTIKRARETNAFGYLLKPFEERELRSTIEMALYKNEAERKLSQNKQWLETILCCIADAVITTSNEGVIEFVNPVAERLTGLPAKEMIARRLSEVVRLLNAKTRENIEIKNDFIMNGGYLSSENDVVLIARDGVETAVEYSIAPLRHTSGKTVGLVLVLRDISVKQQSMSREQALQQRLTRAQRMESLGMLANGVAEQLHRIVGPIVDYPNMILTKIPPEHDIKQDLMMIQNSARKAIEILSDLITLGRLQDYSMEPLQINKLIEDYVNSQSFKDKRQSSPLVDFLLDLSSAGPSLLGCRPYLVDLLNNLISQSFSAIPQAGIVKVSTEITKIPEVIYGFENIEEGEYALLKISNTGRIMSEEEINRFFEPFADKTADAERQAGRGLGTAVAYAIIKGHKGMIDIRSSAEKGTELAVYFPLYSGPVAKAEQPAGAAVTSSAMPEMEEADKARISFEGSETLLLVDDDHELRKSTGAFLRSIGYKVISAKDGSEAVEIFKKTVQKKGGVFDLVVLDMIMADKLDGLDTYKSMLPYNPRQKAVIVSGFSATERIQAAMRLGVGQCLTKPYEQEELAKAIRKELDKPAREPARDTPR